MPKVRSGIESPEPIPEGRPRSYGTLGNVGHPIHVWASPLVVPMPVHRGAISHQPILHVYYDLVS